MAGCGATGEQTHPGDFRSWESPQTLRALFIGPFEHVERFRNLKFAVITGGRGSSVIFIRVRADLVLKPNPV